MAEKKSNLKVILELEDLLTKPLGKSSQAVESFSRTIKSINLESTDRSLRSASQSGKAFHAVLAGFVAGGVASTFTASINAVGGALHKVSSTMDNIGHRAIDVGSALQQNRIAFDTMLGDSKASANLLRDLTNFANATPFQAGEIQTAAKQLLAYSFSASEITKTLKVLGDVSSGVGAPLGEIVYLYGQIRSVGKAFTIDLRQFANRGIPIYKELANVLKTSEANVLSLASEGKIGFKEIEQAFTNMASKGGAFYDLMTRQSDSLSGRLSTLKDVIDLTLSEAVGVDAAGKVAENSVFDLLSRSVLRLTEFLNANKVYIQQFISGLVTGFVGASNVIVEALGRLFPSLAKLIGVDPKNINLTNESMMSLGKQIGGDFANSVAGAVDTLRELLDFMKRVGDQGRRTLQLMEDLGNTGGNVFGVFGVVSKYNDKSQKFSSGGLVKPVYASAGAMIGGPKGSDTVPAWLTPGEAVMSKKAVANFAQGKAGNTIVNIDLSNSVVTNDLVSRLIAEVERALNRKTELNMMGLS